VLCKASSIIPPQEDGITDQCQKDQLTINQKTSHCKVLTGEFPISFMKPRMICSREEPGGTTASLYDYSHCDRIPLKKQNRNKQE